MKIAIMQPYLFPYLGYYQLVSAVDEFVFFDDVNFINRGWINRNNILLNNSAYLFTIPLKNASQNKLIKDIEIQYDEKWRTKFLKTIHVAYNKAPFYEEIIPLLETFLKVQHQNIAIMAAESVKMVFNYLGIHKKFHESNQIDYDRTRNASGKIISICNQLNGNGYINPINGRDLYHPPEFYDHKIELFFIRMKPINYIQYKNDNFIPSLSTLDVMMFNSKEKIKDFLQCYELIT